MKTKITTSVSIVTQQFDDQGDVTGLPVITITEPHEFDTVQQANVFKEELDIWLKELPTPNGNMHPFPRRKIAPTADKLEELIDEIHGPDELWDGYNPLERYREIAPADAYGVSVVETIAGSASVDLRVICPDCGAFATGVGLTEGCDVCRDLPISRLKVTA